jgi:hypothetical protein
MSFMLADSVSTSATSTAPSATLVRDLAAVPVSNKNSNKEEKRASRSLFHSVDKADFDNYIHTLDKLLALSFYIAKVKEDIINHDDKSEEKILIQNDFRSIAALVKPPETDDVDNEQSPAEILAGYTNAKLILLLTQEFANVILCLPYVDARKYLTNREADSLLLNYTLHQIVANNNIDKEVLYTVAQDFVYDIPNLLTRCKLSIMEAGYCDNSMVYSKLDEDLCIDQALMYGIGTINHQIATIENLRKEAEYSAATKQKLRESISDILGSVSDDLLNTIDKEEKFFNNYDASGDSSKTAQRIMTKLGKDLYGKITKNIDRQAIGRLIGQIKEYNKCTVINNDFKIKDTKDEITKRYKQFFGYDVELKGISTYRDRLYNAQHFIDNLKKHIALIKIAKNPIEIIGAFISLADNLKLYSGSVIDNIDKIITDTMFMAGFTRTYYSFGFSNIMVGVRDVMIHSLDQELLYVDLDTYLSGSSGRGGGLQQFIFASEVFKANCINVFEYIIECLEKSLSDDWTTTKRSTNMVYFIDYLERLSKAVDTRHPTKAEEKQGSIQNVRHSIRLVIGLMQDISQEMQLNQNLLNNIISNIKNLAKISNDVIDGGDNVRTAMRIEGLLGALGQAVIGLTAFKVDTNFATQIKNTKEFEALIKFVKDIREYRNARTHDLIVKEAILKTVLNKIQNNHQLFIKLLNDVDRVISAREVSVSTVQSTTQYQPCVFL